MAETFLYITTIGWRSGQPHTIEIWFVEHDGRVYAVAGDRENAHWVRNIRHNAAVQWRLGQGMDDAAPTQPGTAQPLTDDADATVLAVKALMQAKYDWSDGLVVQITPEA